MLRMNVKINKITKGLGSLFASLSRKLRNTVNGTQFDELIDC